MKFKFDSLVLIFDFSFSFLLFLAFAYKLDHSLSHFLPGILWLPSPILPSLRIIQSPWPPFNYLLSEILLARQLHLWDYLLYLISALRN